MRQRARTHNLGTVDATFSTKPSITSLSRSRMPYNRTERNANFFLDLLADKMDVLQRKADMYMRLGEKDALKEIMSSWNGLHAVYNALLSPQMSRKVSTTFKTTKGDALPGDAIISRIQKAMDGADQAMKKAGDMSLQNRRNTIAGLRSEISSLNAAIRLSNSIAKKLRANIKSLSATHAENLASRDGRIADLTSELQGEQARIIDLQTAKDNCEQQVAQLTAEIEDLNEPLVLQSSAFTLGGEDGGPLTLDISNRAKVVEAINSRDDMIAQLKKDTISNIAKLDDLNVVNIENAKKIADAERRAASAAEDADKYKKLTIGAIVAGVVVAGGVYYMSRK